MVEQPVEILAGDSLSFDGFYRSHHKPISSALAVVLRDPDLAAEATDEAMARAFARWGQVSTYGNPAGWVYRVALNWANSALRRLSRRPKIEAPTYVEPPIIDDIALADALEKLDVKMRSVVVCRYLLGWSVEETATALNTKPGTVKSRLSRALDTLKRHVDESEPPTVSQPVFPTNEKTS